MRVFNVNKAIGLASSGVEYAQKYRRELFAGIPWVDDFYVFTDYVGTNLSFFSDRLGFEHSQVLWIYNLVSGRATRPSTITVDDVVSLIAGPHSDPQPGPDFIDVVLESPALRHRLRTLGGGIVDRVETMVGGRVVRVEHYDETLNNVEHFHEGVLARRDFYSGDGRVAAAQFYRGGEITRTVITPSSPLYRRPERKGRPSSFGGDLVLEGRAQFFRFVFGRLFDRPDDVVIVDRAIDVIDGIYPVIGDRRLYSVVHAEHFDLKQSEDGVLLWNNHYENVFTRPDLIDGLVVATARQQTVLEGQLAGAIPVVRIPPGVAEPVAHPDYDPAALVTASRLADEKHLDLLIRAVALARDAVPGIRLDIYGEGDRDPVLAAIAETQTQDWVRLMGHQKLDGLLGSYALYVSASTSEGFGLSLLEALAEGLPIVGFDVDYGNREMVEQSVNGCLVPATRTDRDVVTLSEAIVGLLTSPDFDGLRAASLRKAEAYTAANVRKLWEQLLGGGAPC
ncbi:glycosyltransferase [Gryllotalpicola protaetiae]|uniref:Glycosyltransferase n=2 Tax=Gryllotalpicola protaetiae TaxID=2419771 RepID=A0A387BLW4_9MICO|nr:glycosyltransferase [Gryllotalpicola protaetiae]